MSHSPAAAVKPDVTLSLNLRCPTSHYHALKPEERGIKLIQLLLTCVNHASSGNLHRADTCLRKITELASVSGDSMQRLAARFASALAARLVKRWPGLYKALNNSESRHMETERARAIYAQAFPYMGFAYAIITRVLLQSMSGETVIHVIDLGSGDPKVMLVVEQESNHNWSRLLDRFVEGLHYYSALFDSIDATFGGSLLSEERFIIEEMFGKEIENIVANDGVEREERHERYVKWMVRLCEAGLRPARMWHASMEDAKRLVEGYGLDGYKIIISEKRCLMICWHDWPIYSVSAWICFD